MHELAQPFPRDADFERAVETLMLDSAVARASRSDYALAYLNIRRRFPTAADCALWLIQHAYESGLAAPRDAALPSAPTLPRSAVVFFGNDEVGPLWQILGEGDPVELPETIEVAEGDAVARYGLIS